MMKTALLSLLALPATAFAHNGHGMLGGHWHPTDPFGYVVLGMALAATVWWWGRK
jgi:hypothetical protein